MANFLNTIKQLWANLSLPARIGGSVLVGGVFLSLILFSFLASSNYHPLFTDLSTDDAAAMVSVLRDNSISYKLGSDGTSILVPADQVHETRMTVASQGLPRGGVVGFEIFESNRLGETEADRQLRFLWALQGELTRTITELDEINDARVHIVLPQRSLFIQESRPSTASVLLHLNPGVQLTNHQVRGISHLIATSVEGLNPENVTIVDNRGNVLNDYLDDTQLNGEMIAHRLSVERNYEKQLEESVTAMLERIYGYGQVVVRVNAELDFDRLEEFSERFEAPTRDGGLVRSEQTFQEESRGETMIPGGNPGVDENIPGYVGAANVGDSEYEKREAIINYELNRIERHHTTSPGNIRNLSVSVMIDGDLNPAQINSVQESVSSALGLRLERGDQIFVDSLAFEGETLAATADPLPPPEMLNYTWLYIAIGLLLTLLLLYSFRKKQITAQQEVAATNQVDVSISDQDLEEFRETELSAEEKAKVETKKKIQELAKEKPEEFAKLMKTWLSED